MRILSLTLVYPNPVEPGLGLFVRSRLQHLSAHADLKVIAPVPITDYSNPRGRWLRGRDVPLRRRDERIEVLHPRWAYPPGGTPLNVICLFVRLFWLVAILHRRFPCDVIDAHFGYPEGVVAALLAKVFRRPYTITYRGSETMFAQYRFRRLCLVWATRGAAAVITVSRELGRFAVTMGADPARVFTIPNGIDREVFYPRDRARIRAALGIRDPNVRVILSAGELIEAKGHHLAIQAVHGLLASGRDVRLYVAGGVARGGVRFDRELVQLIRDLGLDTKVFLLGWKDRAELAELMCVADMFCLASYSEGWPNVVNEALACGTPVVASAVGAVPDMLQEHHGLTVPPKDAAALERAFSDALDRNWDRDVIAAWGQSRSWHDVSREVAEKMQRIVAEPSDLRRCSRSTAPTSVSRS